MTVYQSAFSDCSVGPFAAAAKSTAWPDLTISSDNDTNGNLFSIVDDPDLGRCCQVLYKKGLTGNDKGGSYHLSLGTPRDQVSIEWDWKLLPGFDTTSDIFKICPQILWGNDFGANGGMRAIYVNSAPTPSTSNRYWRPILQDQSQSGLILLPFVSSPYYTVGAVSHMKLVLRGGAGGFAKFYLGDMTKPLAFTTTLSPHCTINDAVSICMDYWYNPKTPSVDSLARIGNITITVGTESPAPPIEESIHSARVLLA